MERPSLEERIDEMLADSFPASDPPTWDVVASPPVEDEEPPLLDPELAD